MFFDKIKQMAQDNPDHPALILNDDICTYYDLWHRSQAVGHYLKNFHNTAYPVAIIGDKENDMVAAIFGSILAGKPYVVIPSYYPQKRVEFILNDANVDCFLKPSCKTFDFINLPAADREDIDSFVQQYAHSEPIDSDEMELDHLGALIYTSGSTGNPKGVMVTYRNIMEKVHFSAEHFATIVTDSDFKYINLASYAFCAAYDLPYFLGVTGSIYGSIPREMLTDYRTLFDSMFQIQPNGFFSTPSLIAKLLSIDAFDDNHLKDVKLINVGGEAFPVVMYHQLQDRFKNAHIINIYGMSECLAVGMSFYIYPDQLVTDEPNVPVGLVENSPVFLIDDNGKRVTTENRLGEIVVYGDMVCKGYYKQPELTEKYFFKLDDGTPAFRTRDLAVIRNGKYFFTGRKDHQLKIGGNRVELSDAEENLKKCTIVQDCAIGIRKNPGISMIAFVVLNDEGKVLKRAEAFLLIKKELKNFVEAFMIPRKIVFLDELPRNLNSKIDYELLNQWAQE